MLCFVAGAQPQAPCDSSPCTGILLRCQRCWMGTRLLCSRGAPCTSLLLSASGMLCAAMLSQVQCSWAHWSSPRNLIVAWYSLGSLLPAAVSPLPGTALGFVPWAGHVWTGHQERDHVLFVQQHLHRASSSWTVATSAASITRWWRGWQSCCRSCTSTASHWPSAACRYVGCSLSWPHAGSFCLSLHQASALLPGAGSVLAPGTYPEDATASLLAAPSSQRGGGFSS